MVKNLFFLNQPLEQIFIDYYHPGHTGLKGFLVLFFSSTSEQKKIYSMKAFAHAACFNKWFSCSVAHTKCNVSSLLEFQEKGQTIVMFVWGFHLSNYKKVYISQACFHWRIKSFVTKFLPVEFEGTLYNSVDFSVSWMYLSLR